jgi:hypothetical protein
MSAIVIAVIVLCVLAALGVLWFFFGRGRGRV